MDTNVQACKGCEKGWHQARSLRSWYSDYANWVSVGLCTYVTPALIPGQKVVIPQEQFYLCLQEWFKSVTGQFLSQSVKLDADGKIIGWRDIIVPVSSDDTYEDGPKYLTDIRKLLGTYGIDDSYAYSTDMLTMEMFVVLVGETATIIFSASAACFLVVFLITGGPRLGAIITGSVLLSVYFLLALIPLVSLQFNNVAVIYLITSIGLSVLYSAQISHSYLVVSVDSRLEISKQRNVKARVALARTGSSVLHSAIVTSIAITILGIGTSSYFFEVFFKLWLGIVIFGLLNSFFFVPVILSLIGPTPS